MAYPTSHPLSLLELNGLVRQAIELTMDGRYWVEAEVSELRESHGHCYMELVQKDPHGNVPLARASAKCWRQAWAVLRPYFTRIAGNEPRAGMKMLLEVYPQFHETYGFSWIVTDIDPTYTLGDMARKRQEIVARLKAEGVFTLNKELPLCAIARRIAVISSETAAGYGDFCDQLLHNDYGFGFSVTLFPAVMQGEQVGPSIINALNQINARADEFDCVVIIRGGGATSDMAGFDSLELAENVANFPLPVITGIGHERDECVLDMISHTRVKTPTAAAAFLIAHLKEAADALDSIGERITAAVTHRIGLERGRLDRLAETIPRLFSLARTRQEARLSMLATRLSAATARAVQQQSAGLDRLSQRLKAGAQAMLTGQQHRIALLEQRALALDPALPLKRGYSITLFKGRAIHSPSDIKPGDTIETRVERGAILSVVKPQESAEI